MNLMRFSLREVQPSIQGDSSWPQPKFPNSVPSLSHHTLNFSRTDHDVTACMILLILLPPFQPVQILSLLLGSSQMPHVHVAFWWPWFLVFMIAAHKDHISSVWPLSFPHAMWTLYPKHLSNTQVDSMTWRISEWGMFPYVDTLIIHENRVWCWARSHI